MALITTQRLTPRFTILLLTFTEEKLDANFNLFARTNIDLGFINKFQKQINLLKEMHSVIIAKY